MIHYGQVNKNGEFTSALTETTDDYRAQVTGEQPDHNAKLTEAKNDYTGAAILSG